MKGGTCFRGRSQALSTTELLAITLGTSANGENTLALAQELLVHHGGLPGLSQATIVELTAMRNIGLVRAVNLKASLELGRRLVTTPIEERPRITSPAEAANLLIPEMVHLKQEQLRLILLDTRNRVLSIPTVYVGSLNSAVVRLSELFRFSIRENAAALIVAHNHPSGDPSPSPEDVRLTREVVQAGQLLDISVLDHIIIGGQRFVSLKEKMLGF